MNSIAAKFAFWTRNWNDDARLCFFAAAACALAGLIGRAAAAAGAPDWGLDALLVVAGMYLLMFGVQWLKSARVTPAASAAASREDALNGARRERSAA
ncbi:MAG: hypothetical protein KDA41_09425 [Planctomycetales bacterium]|nr:hypothetical protein [Planctomycetales bacterium]